MEHLDQILSITGALLVLLGYGALQLQKISKDSWTYLGLNLIGGLLLLSTAILTRQWGFILLEGAWTGISFLGILKNLQKPV